MGQEFGGALCGVPHVVVILIQIPLGLHSLIKVAVASLLHNLGCAASATQASIR
jgi:hypothetical protein